jgi:hypothetical protein
MGPRYIAALEQHEDVVAENVTRNLFDRHIRPVFFGAGAMSIASSGARTPEAARH